MCGASLLWLNGLCRRVEARNTGATRRACILGARTTVQGHRAAATERLGALACICRLETARLASGTSGGLGGGGALQGRFTGRLRALRQQPHALKSLCPELEEALWPTLLQFGRG